MLYLRQCCPLNNFMWMGTLDKDVIVQAFTLPHHSKLTDQEYKYGEGINGWNEQQGFYIYRKTD